MCTSNDEISNIFFFFEKSKILNYWNWIVQIKKNIVQRSLEFYQCHQVLNRFSPNGFGKPRGSLIILISHFKYKKTKWGKDLKFNNKPQHSMRSTACNCICLVSLAIIIETHVCVWMAHIANVYVWPLIRNLRTGIDLFTCCQIKSNAKIHTRAHFQWISSA